MPRDRHATDELAVGAPASRGARAATPATPGNSSPAVETAAACGSRASGHDRCSRVGALRSRARRRSGVDSGFVRSRRRDSGIHGGRQRSHRGGDAGRVFWQSDIRAPDRCRVLAAEPQKPPISRLHDHPELRGAGSSAAMSWQWHRELLFSPRSMSVQTCSSRHAVKCAEQCIEGTDGCVLIPPGHRRGAEATAHSAARDRRERCSPIAGDWSPRSGVDYAGCSPASRVGVPDARHYRLPPSGVRQ